jgi:glucokinase
MNLLGIEIGGTKLQLVLGDGGGVIQQRRQLTVARQAGAAGIREQIVRVLPELAREVPVAAAGVGFGGPVDWQTGRICRSHQIEGWSEFDLAAWLRELVGAPVFADNDANVAALGEARHGAGAGCESMLYVTLGSGVGGGLVVGAQIYHGAKPGESEVGHLRLDRSGATVESRCSGWAVDARVRELVHTASTGALARKVAADPGGEARHLGAAWRDGDALARRIVAETAEDLAFGLSHAVHLFHPHAIVLGGGLAGVGEPLRAAVAEALHRHTMEAFAPGLDVRLTALGPDAVPVGALTLAQERLRRSEAAGSA